MRRGRAPVLAALLVRVVTVLGVTGEEEMSGVFGELDQARARRERQQVHQGMERESHCDEAYGLGGRRASPTWHERLDRRRSQPE